MLDLDNYHRSPTENSVTFLHIIRFGQRRRGNLIEI